MKVAAGDRAAQPESVSLTPRLRAISLPNRGGLGGAAIGKRQGVECTGDGGEGRIALVEVAGQRQEHIAAQLGVGVGHLAAGIGDLVAVSRREPLPIASTSSAFTNLRMAYCMFGTSVRLRSWPISESRFGRSS